MIYFKIFRKCIYIFLTEIGFVTFFDIACETDKLIVSSGAFVVSNLFLSQNIPSVTELLGTLTFVA